MGNAMEGRSRRRQVRLPTPLKQEQGVSGAITAMLIILIIGSVIGLIYSVYIPMWTKDAEADQMAETQRQFLTLKETLDTQVVSPESAVGTTVNTRISLGQDGGPIFGVGGTTGALDVNPLAGRLEVYNLLDANETYGLGRGTISFNSSNQQYLQQRFSYEIGALIIAQDEGAVMKVPPHFLARNTTRGDYEVTLTVPALVGNREQVSGTGSYVIQSTLEVVDTNDFSLADAQIGIDLSTEFPVLWSAYFSASLENDSALLAPEYNVTSDTTAGTVHLEFYGVDRLRVNVAVLSVGIL